LKSVPLSVDQAAADPIAGQHRQPMLPRPGANGKSSETTTSLVMGLATFIG
jgi:hypothetical protein